MSLTVRIARHSGIYVVANVLQRGTAFVLLPLYTHVLTPAEYGTIAIVTALAGILAVLLPISINGAITRFYFEYREEPEQLRSFWGAILAFMLLSCGLFGLLLLVFGGAFFEWALGDVAFWPFVAIGIATAMAQPFFQTVQTIFQTREQPLHYAAVSGGHFLLTLLLTIYLILGEGWGAAGPLFAMFVSSILFAAGGLYALRRNFRLSLHPAYLRAALAYVLPQIPHGLSSLALTTTDRFLLNGLVSLAAVGIYNIAALFSLAVDLICQSVNKAFMPMSMRVMQSADPAELAQLRDAGLAMVASFCVIGASLTVFSNEIVGFIAGVAFAGAATYVPFLAFAGVAGGINYVLVNVLFFERAAAKYIPVPTITGGIASIVLNYILIVRLGPLGAAIGTMAAQLVMTLATGLIAARFEHVRWPYGRFAILFVVAFGTAAALAWFAPFGSLGNLALRAGGLFLIVMLLSGIAWSAPLKLLRFGLSLGGAGHRFLVARGGRNVFPEDPE